MLILPQKDQHLGPRREKHSTDGEILRLRAQDGELPGAMHFVDAITAKPIQICSVRDNHNLIADTHNRPRAR